MKNLLLLASAFAALALTAAAAPLEVGDDAPAITATTETGATVDLGVAYKENPYTLVYFYPKAFTGGCTKQGCSLRDGYAELHAKGVAIYGVSADDVATQKKFKDTEHFPFTLISDPELKVAHAFGQNGTKFASRQAYLVHDGRIVYADHKGSTTEQAHDILTFLAEK